MLPELLRTPTLVIIDKPAGLPVHAGPRGGPSVETYFPSLTRKPHGPWLAHRLDADTAGCLAIALTKTTLIAAQAAFAEGRAQKTYWAIVHGQPPTQTGTIDAPMLKRTRKSGWHMAIDQRGDRAVTNYRLLAAAGTLSLLELHPSTGRTHQIRVHCARLGCPIVNDPLYGTPMDRDGGGTLALLARSLTLPLDPPATATAPIPPHMRAILAAHPARLDFAPDHS